MALRTLAERPGRGNRRRRWPRARVAGAHAAGGRLRRATLACLLLGPFSAWGQGALVTPERPAEFMVYQYPDTLLVVRIDVPEAGFSVRTVGPEGARLKESSVPGRRLGPVYQYIDSHERPRQLMIAVTPSRPIERDTIRLELLQFRPDDPNLPRLSHAYRQYSLGLEVAAADDINTWMVKAYALRDAAETFASMGMEEMRLWSEYFAGHLVLHRLGDALSAGEFAAEIGRAARRAGFPEVELAAALLEADARVAQWQARADSGDAEPAARRADEALDRLAGLAASAGRVSEQARALFLQGQVQERQGASAAALQEYAQAEALLAGTTDMELLAAVRDASASLLERSGRTAGALSVLDRAVDGTAAVALPDAELERARALHERGRLLNIAYRHREAAMALAEALALQQAAAGKGAWGPTALELAWSQHALGDFEGAAALARQGIPRTPRTEHDQLLARAWGLLANQHRNRGELGEARRAREQQAAVLGGGPGAARVALESARDALAVPGADVAEAARLLERSVTLARSEGDRVAEGLARLLRCTAAGSACSLEQARAESEDLARLGVPWAEAEGRRLLALVSSAAGQSGASRRELASLLADLYATARLLPGVLEPWLSEHIERLGRDYLRQVAAENDAVESLLALERLRQLDSVRYLPGHPAAADPALDEDLRDRLARAEAARGAEIDGLASRVSKELNDARHACRGCRGEDWAERADVEGQLAGLGPDEAVLAYDFSGASAVAILATRNRNQRIALSAAPALQRALEALSARAAPEITTSDLDRLGEALLAPLGRLPENLYLLAYGPVRGVPLDALRRGGRFLAEEHVVVQIAGLDALGRRAAALPADYRERVFLAGNPRIESDPFDLDLARSAEVSSLSALFVGPGLHVVQGIALQLDEFEDDRFGGARLVHLGAPGRIDLAYPERSRLRLADDVEDPAGWGLSPAQIRAFRIGADLVVLSRTNLAGAAGSVAGRVALVQDFLDAGAARVLYTLWAAPEEAATRWLLDFYSGLNRGESVAMAMARAKRSAIDSGVATNFQTWAGFQLFIR